MTKRPPEKATGCLIYLAIKPSFAEPSQIRAKSRITTQHHSKEIVISIARQARCERHKRSMKTTR
jgi:hypothetical protein